MLYDNFREEIYRDHKILVSYNRNLASKYSETAPCRYFVRVIGRFSMCHAIDLPPDFDPYNQDKIIKRLKKRIDEFSEDEAKYFS